MLVVVPNFADAPTCAAIVAAYDALHVVRPATRVAAASAIVPADLVRGAGDLVEAVVAALREQFDPDDAFDCAFVAELEVGGRHARHADNVMCVADAWQPNHTPHRTVTGLVYLNDDFTGGAIVHHHLGTSIQPVAGTLVMFPCDGHYEHEVLPVTAGRRVSLPVWLKRRA